MRNDDMLSRHAVTVTGDGEIHFLLAHGFGCDQTLWHRVVPSLAAIGRVATFDHAGAGRSAPGAYRPDRHDSLTGYAEDVVALVEALGGGPVIFVGHSVSAMIGVLAARMRPDLFRALVHVGPSARYLNDDGYIGGFEPDDIADLLAAIERNFLGWSDVMAPVITGNADRPALGHELAGAFCRTDPAIALRFARATFLSDNRKDLADVTVPSLVLQCSDDVIAPDSAGHYVHQNSPRSTFHKLAATGHCPHMSHPDELVEAITRYVMTLPA
jgi:sigma-B regulation protein RsbQ